MEQIASPSSLVSSSSSLVAGSNVIATSFTSSTSTTTVPQITSKGLSSTAIEAISASIGGVFIVAIITGGVIWYKLRILRENRRSFDPSTFQEPQQNAEKTHLDAPEDFSQREQCDMQTENIDETPDPMHPSGGLRYHGAEVSDSGRVNMRWD